LGLTQLPAYLPLLLQTLFRRLLPVALSSRSLFPPSELKHFTDYRLSDTKKATGVELDQGCTPRIIIHLSVTSLRRHVVMKDIRILLKIVRPYAGLFAVAFLLMTLVGLFEAGRTALLKSIIDELPGASNGPTTGLAAIVDARNYLPRGVEALPVVAALLVLFTLIRGGSEYLS